MPHEFRHLAVASFAFLEELGFHRAPQLERTTTTSATVIYSGASSAFVFDFDVRDQASGGQIVKLQDGQLCYVADGGYSNSIVSHLVTHGAYKRPATAPRPATTVAEKLDRLAEILKSADLSLFNDRIP